MAIEKVVNLRVESDTSDLEKDFKKVESVIKEAEAVAKKADLGAEATKKLNNEIANTTKAATSVKQQLRELQDRMAAIGDVGSPEFQKLAKEAGVLRDKMNNARAAIDSMSNDFPKLQIGVQAMQAVGGAAQVGVGAMAAFGAENEEVTKSIQKLMAIQSVMNGVQSLANALSDESALGLKVRTILTNLQTKADGKLTVVTLAKAAATGVATTAMAALNAVMNLNPVFLLITGITALVGALIYFSRETEKAQEMNDRLNESYERTVKASEKIVAANEKRRQHELRMLELAGASEEELHKKRLDNLDKENKEREIQLKQEKIVIDQKRKNYEQALKEGNNELAKTIKDEIQQSKDRYAQLDAQHQDYVYSKQEENAQYQKHLEEDAAAEKEKNAQKYREFLAQQRDYNAKRLAVAREIEDKEFQLTFDNQQKQLDELNVWLKREKDDILANEDLIKEEKLKKIEQAEREYYQKRNDIFEENKIVLKTRSSEEAQADLLNKDLAVSTFKTGEEEKTNVFKDHMEQRAAANAEAMQKMEDASQKYTDVSMQGLQALDELNTFLTDQAVKKAGSNERAAEAARKKGFERSKKLQLAMAIITGVQGVMAAFTAGSSMGPAGVVMGPVMAALAAVGAAVNVAKIAKMKYESPSASGGGGSVPSAPSIPSGGASFNVVGSGGANQLQEALGTQKPVQAYVVGSEVTTQQSLDRNKVENATL